MLNVHIDGYRCAYQLAVCPDTGDCNTSIFKSKQNLWIVYEQVLLESNNPHRYNYEKESMEQQQQDWWVRQPQEKEGTYWFSGRFYVTQGVQALLNEDEIFFIYLEIQSLVHEHQGLDYLQVFARELDGQKLFFIDQLTREQVGSGDYLDEHNYCTLMLSGEY